MSTRNIRRNERSLLAAFAKGRSLLLLVLSCHSGSVGPVCTSAVVASILALGRCRPAHAQMEAVSPPDPGAAASDLQIVERGRDFAVYQRACGVTNSDGTISWRTSRFTLLENGLHYLDRETDDWQRSQDVIESFPEGAIARYGPVRAIFSHDLNAENVFDLETPDGRRVRGGLRGLEWVNQLSGERQTLAVVKAQAPLELVPPNQLICRDAFEGVCADVVLEWRHHRFSQAVVLREQPVAPATWTPEAARLTVITEFVETPEADITRVEVSDGAGLPTEDHVTIGVGGLSILIGRAFSAAGGTGVSLGVEETDHHGVLVRKRWNVVGQGAALLEESVSVSELAPLWSALPRQARTERTSERGWRAAQVGRVTDRRAVGIAQGRVSAFRGGGGFRDPTVMYWRGVHP